MSTFLLFISNVFLVFSTIILGVATFKTIKGNPDLIEEVYLAFKIEVKKLLGKYHE